MGCTGAKRGAAVVAPLSTGTLPPWDDDLDICIPAEKMPGKVRHVLSESELLRHIGLFRKKIPFFWYGDEKRTNTLRIKTSLGLTYMRKMLGLFKGISHVSLTFDPVLHGGQEILAVSSPYAPVPYLVAIRCMPISEMQSERGGGCREVPGLHSGWAECYACFRFVPRRLLMECYVCDEVFCARCIRYCRQGGRRTICILCNGDIVDDPGPDSDPWVGAPGQACLQTGRPGMQLSSCISMAASFQGVADSGDGLSQMCF